MLTKSELRKKAREIRHSLDMQKISEKIVENIKKNEIYKQSKHVMIFYPLKHEVNLLGLLENDNFELHSKQSLNQESRLGLPTQQQETINALNVTRDKTFYLPKVDGENMLVCPYKNGDELTESAFKTLEPITTPINPEILDLVFVPALMVDKHLHRLGYGGGFYDKFLSKHSLKSKKIVAIPSALMVEKLPSEDFDAKIDVTICE